MNDRDHMKHLIQLVESAQQLDEGPVGKALATAALSLGLQFGNQVNAEEVYVYKDAQGQFQTAQSTDQVPAGIEYFVIDTDTKTLDVVDKSHTKQTDVEVDTSHISSNTFTSGIDDTEFSRHGVESNNTVTMDFPYKAHKGQLVVQDSGGERLLALYVSGQITGKDMKFKIDNYPTLKNIISQGQKPSTGIIGSTFWEEPWRHGNNQNFFEAFLTPEEKAELDRIMKAGPNYGDGSGPKQNTRGAAEKHNLLHNAWQRIKHEGQTMKVEVNLYQRGPVVYEFNISQLFKSGGGNKAHTPKTLPPSSGDPKSNPVVNAGGIGVYLDKNKVTVGSTEYSDLQKGDIITHVQYKSKKYNIATTDGFKQFIDSNKGKKVVVYGTRNGKSFFTAIGL